MGNCLKTPTSDDISLLHEEHGGLNSRGEPPPPYQVFTLKHQLLTQLPQFLHRIFYLSVICLIVVYLSCLFRRSPVSFYQEEPPYSYFIQSQRAPHLLSEEQQIRLAQRLGLIQHLPVGKYDETKKKRE